MFKYFLSENTKIKHTFVEKLSWISPSFVILLSISLAATYFQVDSYNSWYVTILPGTVALSCALLSKMDGGMKNRAVISLPVELQKVWAAKVLVGIKGLFISCIIIFIAAQLSVFVVNINPVSKIPILNGLAATLILIITYMWQVPLCLYLGNKIGLFPTIILSLGVNVICGVMAIEEYWWMIPFSYPSRLMCPVLRILPNGLLAEPASQTFTPQLLDTWVIPFGISVSFILFLIVTYLTAKWFARQEAI